MSLSRAEGRKRISAAGWLRWAVFVGLILLLLAAGFVYLIRSAGTEYRREEKGAVAVARERAGLTKIDGTVRYTWDKPMWIVFGRDKDNQAWIVWEKDDGVVKERASDGFDKGRIKQRFASDHPSAEIVRLLPGWFADQPVWEIRYRKAPGDSLQSIDFYSFKDGKLLKTYDLPGN